MRFYSFDFRLQSLLHKKGGRVMKQRFRKILRTGFLILFLCYAHTAAAEKKHPQQPVTPTATDKCAVCGMFVAKYPGWIAEVIYKDGSVAFFDGPKDLVTYYFNIKNYTPQKSREEIAAMYVTAYYTGAFINAATALYVTGSDVMGPMGREFIPFSDDAEAREFKRDHKGEKIVAFKQLTPRLFDTNQ
jgi:copper chaperone NosL